MYPVFCLSPVTIQLYLVLPSFSIQFQDEFVTYSYATGIRWLGRLPRYTYIALNVFHIFKLSVMLYPIMFFFSVIALFVIFFIFLWIKILNVKRHLPEKISVPQTQCLKAEIMVDFFNIINITAFGLSLWWNKKLPIFNHIRYTHQRLNSSFSIVFTNP